MSTRKGRERHGDKINTPDCIWEGKKKEGKCIEGANVSYSRRHVNLTSKVQAEVLKISIMGREIY